MGWVDEWVGSVGWVVGDYSMYTLSNKSVPMIKANDKIHQSKQRQTMLNQLRMKTTWRHEWESGWWVVGGGFDIGHRISCLRIKIWSLCKSDILECVRIQYVSWLVLKCRYRENYYYCAHSLYSLSLYHSISL